MAIFLDFPNIIRKMSGDLVVSHSRYQNYLASLMGRVQDIQQFKQVIQVKRWPNLDSDRITDSSQILYMSPIDLLGSDRKSTRLNSSHVAISYAVFCLQKNSNLTP